jgi:hypothetical protein
MYTNYTATVSINYTTVLYLQEDWSQSKFTAYNLLTEEPMSIVFVSSEFVVQHVSSLSIAEAASLLLECVRNVMAHAQKPDLVFRRKGRVHLNRRGRQFSRLLAAELCASAVVMPGTLSSEVVWSGVKRTGYPLHSPVSTSLPLPCVAVCHHVSTGLYRFNKWSRGGKRCDKMVRNTARIPANQ